MKLINKQNGNEVGRKEAGFGSVCIKLFKNLMFSGCYDGFIYVHDKNTGEYIDKIQGPGKTLLFIEIYQTKVYKI